MKAHITVTSKDFMRQISHLFPNISIDYIWFELQETIEHWETKNNKSRHVLKKFPVLAKQSFKIFSDGSFEKGEDL